MSPATFTAATEFPTTTRKQRRKHSSGLPQGQHPAEVSPLVPDRLRGASALPCTGMRTPGLQTPKSRSPNSWPQPNRDDFCHGSQEAVMSPATNSKSLNTGNMDSLPRDSTEWVLGSSGRDNGSAGGGGGGGAGVTGGLGLCGPNKSRRGPCFSRMDTEGSSRGGRVLGRGATTGGEPLPWSGDIVCRKRQGLESRPSYPGNPRFSPGFLDRS